ncbi:MAG: hypothetical protein AAF993_00190 [Pseudomonadota bacterium]
MHKFQFLLAGALLLVSGSALSSGGFGGGSPGGGLSGGAAPRVVDEAYEFGKSVYKGRAQGSEKIDYCVKVDGEVKKLKRSTAKSYRNGPTRDFALALIDCETPDRLALTTMSREHVPLVLYYLNKRYKLDLTDNPPG